MSCRVDGRVIRIRHGIVSLISLIDGNGTCNITNTLNTMVMMVVVVGDDYADNDHDDGDGDGGGG